MSQDEWVGSLFGNREGRSFVFQARWVCLLAFSLAFGDSFGGLFLL